ncbi:MAG: hypothetical protein ACRDXD_06795 [Acidimicrobiia bacterium]
MAAELPPEMVEALRRGGRRAGVHLVRAGMELLQAVEAFLDELSPDEGAAEGPEHIPVEGEEEPG